MSSTIQNPNMERKRTWAKTTYIGATGPLKKVCERTFRWNSKEPVVVIVWHHGWMQTKPNFWRQLHDVLEGSSNPVRILVTFFGDTPDSFDSKESGKPLSFLIKTMAADVRRSPENHTSGAVGWASITNFTRHVSASVVWRKPDDNADSALLQLCLVAAALGDRRKPGKNSPPRPNLCEFFRFLSYPDSFLTRCLHDKPKDAIQGLRVIKWLAVHVTVPKSLPINILLIENKPNVLRKTDDAIRKDLGHFNLSASPLGFFKKATFYLVEGDFEKLRTDADREELIVKVWKPLCSEAPQEAWVPWNEIKDDIDLVLQDIVLDNDGVTGLELVPNYFEACPQALVFLLTSLDVESLVGAGGVNWRYVDCVVSKNAMATLWYEYQRCFQERFGRMFWQDWGAATAGNRKLLRNLFSSLRKWQIEPDILWHGQSLPEMIDHANRHITGLWRLTNDFVATLIENGGAKPQALSLPNKVALALAVWMHDVGHRGDEYVAGSMEIRASHAGISERLLLRNPDAYGLGWLRQSEHMPHKPCRSKSDTTGCKARLECRNQAGCNGEATPLCLLREVGLLCRHHQSNAPLDITALSHMADRGKSPSVYSLVPDSDDKSISSEGFLRGMTNEALPMPSPRGSKVLTLEHFVTSQSDGFRCLAGLLRMLDALQLHRTRVGTLASMNSYIEFLETKFAWCNSERERLETNRRSAMEGRSAFQRVSGKIHELDEYEILLKTQQVHSWRQAVVHDVDVRWRWEAGGKAAAEILFLLNERALAHLGRNEVKVPVSSASHETLKLSNILRPIKPFSSSPWPSDVDLPVRKWIHNVNKEVVGSEHESQYPASAPKPKPGYLGVLLDDVQFRVGVAGTDRKVFSLPYYIFKKP